MRTDKSIIIPPSCTLNIVNTCASIQVFLLTALLLYRIHLMDLQYIMECSKSSSSFILQFSYFRTTIVTGVIGAAEIVLTVAETNGFIINEGDVKTIQFMCQLRYKKLK